jgi:mannose-6-phosphate isomerase class I
MTMLPTPWRKTTQTLAPLHHPAPQAGNPSDATAGGYDLYPGFPLGSGKLTVGYAALAAQLHQAPSAREVVILDGYIGVFWEQLVAELDRAFAALGVAVTWVDIRRALRPAAEIQALTAPFLGGDDPIFGTCFTGALADFFDPTLLAALAPNPSGLTIVYGCGAALSGWQGALVYVDLPKNEIQFRARAGAITNLGMTAPAPDKAMYKRFYFVDWVALNRHKADLLPRLDWIVDGQRPAEPVWATGDTLRAALSAMSRTYFRVRPWFEPGAWGGQWLKAHIPQLPQDAINYAWSFELIVPENGLLLESDGLLLEVSFDLLMFHSAPAVLGRSADIFGTEFPIRFDFLDTFDGGNLSVQCHPAPAYIRREFGERFTQDETYYILDARPGAQVYLGFQAGIDPDAFRAALEASQATAQPIQVEQFVQHFPADKHALFLIPHGTVHCSGKDVMVLEISATPYIFTFKMYDWMRLDLDGKPRPINIDRAFANLNFSRQGARVREELIARPTVIAAGPDWQLVHLPTHPDHFYDVHRFEFDRMVEATTDGSCHVMSLVEGTSVLLEVAHPEGGFTHQRFHYAETFVVPAEAGSYRLIHQGNGRAKVVKAFIKPTLDASPTLNASPTLDASRVGK